MLQCVRCFDQSPEVLSILYFAYHIVPVFTALQKSILPLFSFACFINLKTVSFLFPAIECRVPKISLGNRTEGNPPFSYKSEAAFECWPGYRMKGLAPSLYEEGGWSALPVCVEGKLNLLNAIMDGIFSQGVDL